MEVEEEVRRLVSVDEEKKLQEVNLRFSGIGCGTSGLG